MVGEAKEEFDQEDVRKITRVITLMTKERYSGDPRWTRIEEIVRFCQLSEFKKIGIAACIGFHNEAKELTKILRSAGLEVTLVLCQVGAFSEEETGVWMPCISGGIVPSVCNPVMQAWVLNSRKTELNIAMGLCLGDDFLFQKYSAAPVTTLAVKDRATGNDTLAPIYAFHLRRFLKDKFGG
jgi:uncharacterized metal-binding protein